MLRGGRCGCGERDSRAERSLNHACYDKICHGHTTSVYYTSAYTGAPNLEHNSEEGSVECARQEAGERAKSAENKQELTKDRLNERQWQREQMDPNEPFVGALNSRKKAELQDVAYALGLNILERVN